MFWERLIIESDATGDDRAAFELEGAPFFAALRSLDDLPADYLSAAQRPASPEALSFAELEAAMCGEGLRARDLWVLIRALRTVAFDDSSRGEYPVKLSGVHGDPEREPDYVTSITSALEHLAWLAGDLGRIRVRAADGATA